MNEEYPSEEFDQKILIRIVGERVNGDKLFQDEVNDFITSGWEVVEIDNRYGVVIVSLFRRK